MAKDNKKKKRRFDDGYEPQGTPEALATPVEQLHLKENTLDILKKGGIVTAKDLAKRCMSQMYKIKFVGKRECLEVKEALATIGLSYREELQKQNAQQNKNAENKQSKGDKKENANTGSQKGKQSDNKKSDRQNQKQDANAKNAKQSVKNDKKERSDAVAFADKKEGKQQLAKADKKDKNAVASKSNDRAAKQKNKQQNAQPQRPKYDYKQYEGMTLHEIIYGKREKPVAEKPKKDQLKPDSIVKFCRKGKWGYKDWKGNVLIQPVYDDAFSFHDGMACVEKDGKLGFINAKNELVIDYKYDSATSFSQGLASVSIDEKSGYIDKEGNVVLELKFDIATSFENGKAIVREDGRWGVLDRETLTVLWR